MKKLETQDIKETFNLYASNEMIGKKIYMKRTDKESDMYYIYSISDIINTSFPIKYELKNCFMLLVPKNQDRKVHVYEKYKDIELKYIDVLYELDYNEWLETFRVFVKYDGDYVRNLPSKIIQDN